MNEVPKQTAHLACASTGSWHWVQQRSMALRAPGTRICFPTAAHCYSISPTCPQANQDLTDRSQSRGEAGAWCHIIEWRPVWRADKGNSLLEFHLWVLENLVHFWFSFCVPDLPDLFFPIPMWMNFSFKHPEKWSWTSGLTELENI